MRNQRSSCYVVGAGEMYGQPPAPEPGDFVIAADGGFGYLTAQGIRADLVVGDFDSLGTLPEHANVIRLEKEKDETDTLAALMIGLKRGFRLFHIHGGTGGREDHTLANLQSLVYLSKREAIGFLYGRDTVMTAITSSSLGLPAELSGYLSVFAHSDRASGVDLEGLKYELRNAELTNEFPLGVSNEFVGKGSRIRVREGTLLVVFPRDEESIKEVSFS